MTSSPSAAGGGGGAGWRGVVAVARIGVPVALSAWIVSLADWGRVWSALTAAQPAALAGAAVLFVAGLVISAHKWQRLLAIHGLRYPLGALVRWYLVAGFFNHLLPTSIGGDGYRLYRTWDNRRGRSASVLVIVLERVTGVVALAALALGSALVLHLSGREGLAGWALAIGAGVAGAAGLVAWLALRRWGRSGTGGTGRLARWSGLVRALLDDLRGQPGALAIVLAISFLFHATRITAVWLVLFGLGATAHPLELTVAMFAVDVAGLLPLSLGGLGLIEGSFMLAMGHFGVAEELSLAAMLLVRAMTLALALAGAFFWMRGGRDRPEPAHHSHAGPRAPVEPEA